MVIYFIERVLSMKKVRYLMGAAGAIPALGVVAHTPPSVTAVHGAKTAPVVVRVKPGKTVYIHPDAGCTGSTPEHKTLWSGHQSLTVGYWSTRHGGKICIGTMWLHDNQPYVQSVSISLYAKDGAFYCHQKGYTDAAHPTQYDSCHGSFYTPFNIIGQTFIDGNSTGYLVDSVR